MFFKISSVSRRFYTVIYTNGDPTCWAEAALDWFFGAIMVVAWSGFIGQMRPTWLWLGPGLLIAAWSGADKILRGQQTSARASYTLAAITVATSAMLPAWPGVTTQVMQAFVIAMALLATRVARMPARLANGPKPSREEKTRVILLMVVVLTTWWAYFTPQIVGVVDERWYGDLMEDFLTQTRNGIFRSSSVRVNLPGTEIPIPSGVHPGTIILVRCSTLSHYANSHRWQCNI